MSNYSIYLHKLQLLAEGSVSPKEISVWAEKEESLRDNDIAPIPDMDYELLGTLQISGALNENGDYLYNQRDFRSWYDDFRSRI